jgi:hypothetical protein
MGLLSGAGRLAHGTGCLSYAAGRRLRPERYQENAYQEHEGG